MRLNEAASALAAAAADAVLEATQNPSQRVADIAHMPRFGSMHQNQATSSEDGESINSNSFFSRKLVGPESTVKVYIFAKARLLVKTTDKGLGKYIVNAFSK